LYGTILAICLSKTFNSRLACFISVLKRHVNFYVKYVKKVQSSGILKTTSEINNLLEKLTEFRKDITLTVSIHHSEGGSAQRWYKRILAISFQ
jgi:hypothetical protein